MGSTSAGSSASSVAGVPQKLLPQIVKDKGQQASNAINAAPSRYDIGPMLNRSAARYDPIAELALRTSSDDPGKDPIPAPDSPSLLPAKKRKSTQNRAGTILTDAGAADMSSTLGTIGGRSSLLGL